MHAESVPWSDATYTDRKQVWTRICTSTRDNKIARYNLLCWFAMTSAHQQLLLQALAHKSSSAVKTDTQKGFRALVAWLEHTQIRHYATEDRKGLSDIASERWPAAFAKYLKDLECPFDSNTAPAESSGIMDWLLHYAVDLTYSDRAEDIEKQLSQASSRQRTASDIRDTDLSGVHSPEVQAGVAQLLKTLQLPAVKGPIAQQLATATQVLAEDVLPALKHAPDSQANSSPAVNFACLPLGFTTGDAVLLHPDLAPKTEVTSAVAADKKLDTAAMVLRMLYIKDLRKLQTQIDEMIVQVQEYTANPRIDSGLGIVGR